MKKDVREKSFGNWGIGENETPLETTPLKLRTGGLKAWLNDEQLKFVCGPDGIQILTSSG